MIHLLNSLQSTFIPTTYEDVPRTVLATQVLRISDSIRGNHSCSARMHAFILPFFASLAVIQQATLLLSDTLSYLSGQPRKVHHVLNPETSVVRDASVTEDFIELIRTTLACVTVVFTWALSWTFCPNIYAREPLKKLPVDIHQKELMQSRNEAFQRAQQCMQHNIDLFIAMFGRVTPQNFDAWRQRIEAIKGRGIHLPLWIGKWGNDSKDPLYPLGLMGIKVDCRTFSPENLHAILHHSHQFGRIDLDYPTQAHLNILPQCACLPNVHSLGLTLDPKNPLNLSKIDVNCPRIVFLDLQGYLPSLPESLLFRFKDSDSGIFTNQDGLFRDYHDRSNSIRIEPPDRWPHPVTPFLREFTLLRNSGLSSRELRDALPLIKGQFPNATRYDFSGCHQLDFTALDLFSENPPKFLIMRECRNLFRQGRRFMLDSLLPKLDLLFQNGAEEITLSSSITEEINIEAVEAIFRDHPLRQCNDGKKLHILLTLYHPRSHGSFQMTVVKEKGSPIHISKTESGVTQLLTPRGYRGHQTARDARLFTPRQYQTRSLSVPNTSRGAPAEPGSPSPVPRLNLGAILAQRGSDPCRPSRSASARTIPGQATR